ERRGFGTAGPRGFWRSAEGSEPGLRFGGADRRLCAGPCGLRHQRGGRGRGGQGFRLSEADGRTGRVGRAGAGTWSEAVKFQSEYRDAGAAQGFAQQIRRITTRPWTIMEICGGQTHAIVKFGLDELLPETLEMVHGPGCPVCVTPLELIDKAVQIAGRPEVIFCSFGDMLRVPGSDSDLFGIKARGGDVRILYSPLDALR